MPLTRDEIRQVEEQSGIAPVMLMENAGKNKRILIVAYHGNNGGDGFVAARHLCTNAEVDVLFVGDEKKLKDGALHNYRRIEDNEMIQMLALEAVDFSDYDIIVDAIFGTGIEKDVHDPLATLIRKLSSAKATKVSIDVPSGINPDTGEKANVWFEPDLIVTMHDMKKGLGAYTDKTIVVDIGIKKN
jgi:hydroxyethylthiazole kinase-like uncharacterized protein yjeF